MKNIFLATVICIPQKIKAAPQKICSNKIMEILWKSSARTKKLEGLSLSTDFTDGHRLWPKTEIHQVKSNFWKSFSLKFFVPEKKRFLQFFGTTENTEGQKSQSVKICAICGQKTWYKKICSLYFLLDASVSKCWLLPLWRVRVLQFNPVRLTVSLLPD